MASRSPVSNRSLNSGRVKASNRSAVSNRYLLLPNLFNFRNENTSNWRTARKNVSNGTANARILYFGNSVVLGVGSGTSNTAFTSGEMKSLSAPSQVSGLLNTAGVNSHANSFFGSGQNVSVTTWPSFFNATADPRIVIGSSWTPSTSATMGGAYLNATTSTNAFSFTPTVNVDTFDIFCAVRTGGGFGIIQADINGGTPVTLNTNTGTGTISIQKMTVTGTLGSNTVNVKSNTGSAIFGGISSYDSSKKWVDVMNGGWSGGIWSGSGQGFMANAGAVAAITGTSPNIVILQGGINDWVGGLNTTTYVNSLQTMITAAKNAGSNVLLTTDNPTITTSASTATQLKYISFMYTLASNNNIPLLDLWQRWGSYTSADAKGWVFHDNTNTNYHPNNTGYADIATAVSKVLLF